MARTHQQQQQRPPPWPQAHQPDGAAGGGAATAAAMKAARHGRRGAAKGGGAAAAVAAAAAAAAQPRLEMRTKVVVRHLPPAMGAAALAEELESRFGGMFTWMALRPGKASHRRQVHGVAYINFNSPEDVLRFYEDFEGHVFVSEKGAQSKAAVEYAPYQRVPKPDLKKDAREGTIFRDPDYLAFLDTLGKPQEFLPSAEVQLERREAEKAAAVANGVKDPVVVTPLMEFVRQKRAAKAAPPRSITAAKLAARLGSGGMKISVRGDKGGGLPEQEAASVSSGGSASRAGGYEGLGSGSVVSRRDEQQHQQLRRERDVDRRRKEAGDVKEKKLVREAVAAALSSTRTSLRADSSSGDHAQAAKSGQEGLPDADSRGPSPASSASYTHRNRPPQSPKHGSLQVSHLGGAGSVSANSKPSHGKEAGARGFRGMVSNQLSLLQPSSPHTPLQESQNQQPQQQQPFQQADKGSRLEKQDARRVRNKDRPDRPVWTPRRRADSVPDPAPIATASGSALLTAATSGMPATTAGVAVGISQPVTDVTSKAERSIRSPHPRQGGKSNAGQMFVTVDRGAETGQADTVNQSDPVLETFSPSSRKGRYPEFLRLSRGARAIAPHAGQDSLTPIETEGRSQPSVLDLKGQSGQGHLDNGETISCPMLQSVTLKDRKKQEAPSIWNELGGTPKQVGRRDRSFQQGLKEADSFLGLPDSGKGVKRGGAIALGGSEKQVWVAVQKAGTGP